MRRKEENVFKNLNNPPFIVETGQKIPQNKWHALGPKTTTTITLPTTNSETSKAPNKPTQYKWVSWKNEEQPVKITTRDSMFQPKMQINYIAGPENELTKEEASKLFNI